MFDTSLPAYKSLRDIISQRTNRLVFWVGAGVSAPAGLPTWGRLREQLQASAREKIKSFSTTEIVPLEGKLRAAEKEEDPWLAFQHLAEVHGEASWHDEIKKALTPDPSKPIPSSYSTIWKLPVDGVLNLNLDRLATQSHSLVYQGKRRVIEFSGRKAGEYAQILNSRQDFIVNLHGVAHDSTEWVLTRRQLRSLLVNPGYKAFISACGITRTLVFLGLTAEDVAVGSHLESFVRSGISTGPHFWITNRSDVKTDSWAEARGIRIIRYRSPTSGNHTELEQMFDDLLKHVPTEDEADPVLISAPGTSAPILPPEELVLESDEQIRMVLNAHASEIFSDGSPDPYGRYRVFSKKYAKAIHRAWYRTTEPPDNVLMGYTLVRRVGQGAFGEVFEAKDPQGNPVALKLLHQAIRENEDMLASFRRGVRSMRILSENKVEGMVPYKKASEIPAFAVMDFVEGPNLKEAVESRELSSWQALLHVAMQLVTILRRAHLLPERVLHRDVRPSNIMLRGFYSDPDNWDVVVLDFDLSWHRDAVEKSIIAAQSLHGYLAPEQLTRIPGVSTRHAAVDSFGVGMTLLYLCLGRDPHPGEHQQAKWGQLVRDSLSAKPCNEWNSLPFRIGRLIENATRHEQSQRWDMGQIERELFRINEALLTPKSVESAELWAEEILATSQCVPKYDWNPDQLGMSTALASGIVVKVFGKEELQGINLDFEWASVGDEEHSNLRKYIYDARLKMDSLLRKRGWSVNSTSSSGKTLYLSASTTVNKAKVAMAELAKGMREAMDCLKF